MFAAHFLRAKTSRALVTVFVSFNCVAAEDDYWAPVPAASPPVVQKLVFAGTNLVAAGYFDSIGGAAATNIAHWDGLKWFAVEKPLANIETIAGDGTNVYAAASFPSYPLGKVFRWDGFQWLPLGKGFDGYARVLAFLGDDLFAAGRFRTADGTAATNIARWDGNQWLSLGAGLRLLEPQCHDCSPDDPGIHGRVKAIAAMGDQLFAGGKFDWADGGEPPT